MREWREGEKSVRNLITWEPIESKALITEVSSHYEYSQNLITVGKRGYCQGIDRIAKGCRSDRQGSRDDERKRGQQQEIAEAAEKQAGRSTGQVGPVDRHAQHARGPDAVDRPVDRNSLTVSAQLSVVFGRPTGRPRWRSVDQPVDRQSGLG